MCKDDKSLFVDVIAPCIIFYVFKSIEFVYRFWSYQDPALYDEPKRKQLIDQHEWVLNESGWGKYITDLFGMKYVTDWRLNEDVKEPLKIRILGWICWVIAFTSLLFTVIPGPWKSHPSFIHYRIIVIVIIARAILSLFFNAREKNNFKDILMHDVVGEIYKERNERRDYFDSAARALWRLLNKLRQEFDDVFKFKDTYLAKMRDEARKKRILPQHIQDFWMTMPMPNTKVALKDMQTTRFLMYWLTVGPGGTHGMIMLVTYVYIVYAAYLMTYKWKTQDQPDEKNSLMQVLRFIYVAIVCLVILLIYLILMWFLWAFGKNALTSAARNMEGEEGPKIFGWVLYEDAQRDALYFGWKEHFLKFWKGIIMPVLIGAVISACFTSVFVLWKELKMKSHAIDKQKLGANEGEADEQADMEPEELAMTDVEYSAFSDRIRVYLSVFVMFMMVISIIAMTLNYIGITLAGVDLALIISVSFVLLLIVYVLFHRPEYVEKAKVDN